MLKIASDINLVGVLGGCVMGQGWGRLARSRRVQLMPIPQADGRQLLLDARLDVVVRR